MMARLAANRHGPLSRSIEQADREARDASAGDQAQDERGVIARIKEAIATDDLTAEDLGIVTYEFDQTFVAESFGALYVERGRPTLGRADLARRYEFCEDLAQQLAQSSGTLHLAQGLSTDEVLSRCLNGLRTPQSALPDREAVWVTRRTAELLTWTAPVTHRDF